MIVIFGRVMRGAIDAAIKGKRQAKGGNYRGGAIYGGETDKSMGTVVIGGMAGIVQRRGQYHHPPPYPLTSPTPISKEVGVGGEWKVGGSQ